jgi:hypothetical protein
VRLWKCVLPVAVGLLLVVGCAGDGETETVVKTVTQEEPAAPEDAAPEGGTEPDPELGCDEQGINPEERQEGTCTEDAVRYTVVNKDSTVRIPEVSARFVSIEQAKTLSSDLDTLTANGTFVIVRVAVKNRLHSPTRVEQGQFILIVNHNNYTEHFDAENGVVQDSFIWQQRHPTRRDQDRGSRVRHPTAGREEGRAGWEPIRDSVQRGR